MSLTQQELKINLSYDSETGIFTYLSVVKGRKVGEIAGTKTGRYVKIYISKTGYYAHRLAFLYMSGSIPDGGMHIDHINGDGRDNRWENLRVATPQQNQFNRRNLNKNNNTGVSEVTFSKEENKFIAQYAHSGKHVYVGRFLTLEEAKNAYLGAIKYKGEFTPQ